MYPQDVHDNLLSQPHRDILTSGALFCIDLGKPVVADVDRIVTSTNMKVGAYTIAAQPDVPRNITVSATAGNTADTMGTITVTGTNYAGAAISEVITPVAGSTIAGTKAFAAVTSVVGAGWVIDGSEGTNDTITVGVGTELGLPFALHAAADAPFGVLGGTMLACATTVTDPGTVEGTTVDMSAGTYDGAKLAQVLVRYSA